MSLAAITAEAPKKEPQVIHWVVNDFPPFFAIGLRKYRSEYFQSSRRPGRDVPGYGFVLAPVSTSVFADPVCARGKTFYREKNNTALYSCKKMSSARTICFFGEEVARTLPPGLIVPVSSQPQLAKYIENNEIDLAKVLSDKNFRVGVVQGRSYTKAINELVEGTKSSFKLVTDRAAGSLFVMLNSARLDGVLAYYLEQGSYEKNIPKRESCFFRIKQAPDLISLHASCEKSDWGEKFLKMFPKS